MAILDFAGAETATAIGAIDGDGVTLSGSAASIAAGAVFGQGAYHYHVDGTVTGGGKFKFGLGGVSFVGNQYVFQIDCALKQEFGPQADETLFFSPANAAVWKVLYTGASDTPPKLRFYVSGVEINAAAAILAPLLFSPFKMLVYIQNVAPFACKLYIDINDGNGYVLRQSGNAGSAPNPTFEVWAGQTFKGSATDLSMKFDNYIAQSDATSFATSPGLAYPLWLDCLVELPATDGGNNQWTNHLGTACNTTSTTCQTEVSHMPTDDASAMTTYIDKSTTVVGHYLQDFNMANAFTISGSDVPYAMRTTVVGVQVGGALNDCNLTIDINSTAAGPAGGTVVLTSSIKWLYGGAFDHEPSGPAAWTVANFTAARQGIDMGKAVASPTVGHVKVGEVYRSFVYQKVAAGAARRRVAMWS